MLMLAAGLLFLIASCDNEPERHQLLPVEQPFVLYADQTTDSLCFYTFDSWTVTPQEEWITIDGDSHMDIKYNYMRNYLCKVMVSLEPNMTGQTRHCSVLVQSHDYSYSSPFVQLGILQLSHPIGTVDTWLDEQSGIPDVAHYELIDSAHWESDYICFTVHDDWELVFVDGKPEWLDVDKMTGPSGRFSVNLTLAPNIDTENEREAKLRLTSRGVSNEIVVHQLPAKKEEEE